MTPNQTILAAVKAGQPIPPRQPRVKTLAQWLAHLIEAKQNCIKSGNDRMAGEHANRIRKLNQFLPSGSGFDNGCFLDQLRSGRDVLRICASFHHMDDAGGYDGWTDHVVSVRPTFYGFEVTSVTGRDRNQIKEHVSDSVLECLRLRITETSTGTFWCDASENCQ